MIIRALLVAVVLLAPVFLVGCNIPVKCNQLLAEGFDPIEMSDRVIVLRH